MNLGRSLPPSPSPTPRRASFTEAAALAIYAALLRLATPLYLLRLLWRSRKEPLYRHGMLARLGLGLAQKPPGAIWLHAVSLGESRAAAPLIAALRAQRPDAALLLTSSTATGWQAAEQLLLPGDRHAWLPYDTPGAVRRFLTAERPAVGILMETEVWPTLLHEARRQGLPMVLANARLSERSARKADRLDALLRPAARALALTLAQSPADAERLRAAGADPVEVAGNLKYDMQPPAEQLARGAAWRAALGRPVVLAASTRAAPSTLGERDEEAQIAEAWQRMQWAAGSPPPLLVIVPRHPQRFEAVAALLAQSGLRTARRSSWGDGQPPNEALQADVWLGDTVGELPAYYAMADVALLGGSFLPLGGQNLIEGAACGCPMVIGPSVFNFAQAAQEAVAAGAAWQAGDVTAAMQSACHIALADAPKRAAVRGLAQRFATHRGGAARRMAQAIAGLVQRSAVPS